MTNLNQWDIYFAYRLPFIDGLQKANVIAVEQLLEKNNIEFHSPRLDGVLGKMTNEEKVKKSKELFEKNIIKLEMCNIMLALIDDIDQGVSFEMGYFYAMKKDIITMSFKEYGTNLMLAHATKAHLRHGIIDLKKFIQIAEDNPTLIGKEYFPNSIKATS